MAYVKNTWVDQNVERPKTYEVTNNQDGSITLTDSFGNVTELGTPVNATNMNHIEDGLALSDLMKYSASVTYSADEWVTGTVNNKKGIYKSLVNNNTGNALTDDTKWEEVQLGGGTRNIGEIVTSTIPLTDADLHLLDGALLSYGSYQAFIDYIADLYDSGDYTDIFETEANWQTAVTTYGVCGKFVYDDVNNTVRLPKYSNKIYTKNITSTAPIKGTGNALGLHNGVQYFGIQGAAGTGLLYGQTGSYNLNVGTSQMGSSNIDANKVIGVTTDSTKSGVITDLANITTPLEGYYYIVIATATKTEIEVDIDEVVTDLNGKADVDLSNVDNAGTSKVAGWAMPSNTYTNLTLGASGTTYTAPANGYVYFSRRAGANSQYMTLDNVTSQFNIELDLPTINNRGTILLPVKKNDVYGTYYSVNGSDLIFRFFYAQGSESEA